MIQQVIARLVDRMQFETKRVTQTIDDLLDMSNIEAGGLPDKELVSARTVIEQALSGVQYAAEHHNIAVSVEIADGTMIFRIVSSFDVCHSPSSGKRSEVFA